MVNQGIFSRNSPRLKQKMSSKIFFEDYFILTQTHFESRINDFHEVTIDGRNLFKNTDFIQSFVIARVRRQSLVQTRIGLFDFNMRWNIGLCMFGGSRCYNDRCTKVISLHRFAMIRDRRLPLLHFPQLAISPQDTSPLTILSIVYIHPFHAVWK